MFRKSITIRDGQYTSARQKILWLPELKLDESDKEALLAPTGWLSGNLINAAQELLKKQFSNLSAGLQGVELGLVMNFKIPGCEFLQILHSPPNHWVTVSTIGIQDTSTIILFDSKYKTVPTSLQAQIAALLRTDCDKIVVRVMNVQNQVCVYFVLASYKFMFVLSL